MNCNCDRKSAFHATNPEGHRSGCPARPGAYLNPFSTDADYPKVREAVDRAWHVTRAYEEPVRIDIIARCAFDVLHPREVTLDDLTVPDQGYTVEIGGQRFTQAQWEAVQTWAEGTSAMAQEADNRPCTCPDPEIAARSGHVSKCGAA